MLNKKAGEKMLSLWWFFVIVFISIGIVAGVLIFYAAEVNVKEVEANILAEKIMRCLNDYGNLQDGFMNEDFDVFNRCGLAKNVFNPDSDFYFKIEAYNESGQLIRGRIDGGNAAYEKDCFISKAVRAAKYPKCVLEKENVIYYSNGDFKIVRLEVLAGSNQGVKKIKVVENG